MITTLETRIISNFLLYVDNALQKYGSAYRNASGLLYPVASDVANYYAYATPFKPLCNDTSITGARVMSGVYVNGTYTPLGSGGLTAINHNKGMVYFSAPLAANAVVSGNYAQKEFNIVLANQLEWNQLFKTNPVADNSKPQNPTGISYNTQPSPVIYVVVKGQENKPFGFQKIDESQVKLRCIVITDNEFQNVGACSVLKNMRESHLPMLTGLPFSQNGTTTGSMFNFDTNGRDSAYNPWIAEARGSDVLRKGDFADIERNLACVDFMLSTVIVNR